MVWIWQKNKIKKLESDLAAAEKEKEEAGETGRGLAEYGRKVQEKKSEQKAKIFAALQEKGKITNDEVQALLGVSDATATRYLDELEKEDKVVRQGVQKGTFYILK